MPIILSFGQAMTNFDYIFHLRFFFTENMHRFIWKWAFSHIGFFFLIFETPHQLTLNVDVISKLFVPNHWYNEANCVHLNILLQLPSVNLFKINFAKNYSKLFKCFSYQIAIFLSRRYVNLLDKRQTNFHLEPQVFIMTSRQTVNIIQM